MKWSVLVILLAAIAPASLARAGGLNFSGACVFVGDAHHPTDTAVKTDGRCGPGPTQTASVGVDPTGVTACTRDDCVHVVIALDEHLTPWLPKIENPLLP